MKLNSCILVLILVNCLNSQSQNLFVAGYNNAAGSAESLICYDRSFFITVQPNSGGPAFIVMKTDSAGNIFWSNEIQYPNSTFFLLADIVQAADSGFLILFNRTETGMNHSDPTVTKLDKSGNYLWTKRYVSVLSAFGNSIIKNNDNGYMVVGSRQLNDFVMKCNNAGGITWLKQFVSGGTSAVNYFISTHDYNRFTVIGRHGSNILYFETDLSGNLYWQSEISFANTGIGARSLKPLKDGGYIAAGAVNYITGNSNDAFLAKTDSAGTLVWLKIFSAGLETSGDDVAELSDSSLLMVGFTAGMNGDGYAIKTDKDGNFQFAKTEVNPSFNKYYSVNSFSPGTVMLSGKGYYSFIALADTACSSLCNVSPLSVLESVPAYTYSLLTFTPVTLPFAEDSVQINYMAHPLIKDVLCGFNSANEIISQNEIQIYPDPATDRLNIKISNNELSEIILYDIASAKLVQQKFTNAVSLNISQLAKGIYFYEIKSKNREIKKGKVMKM